jgi:hypothetical protein
MWAGDKRRRRSLLAKVYLYQQKWDSSLVYSNLVINSGNTV